MPRLPLGNFSKTLLSLKFGKNNSQFFQIGLEIFLKFLQLFFLNLFFSNFQKKKVP